MPKVIRGAEVRWGTCSRTVLLGRKTWALSYWNNIVTIGSEDGDIIMLDAVTGSQMAILSEHLQEVNCFTFSSDGKSLVSGSDDMTVKLWDIQTGGVVKTFHGHTESVWSVSISADCTRVASGSGDNTIHLWDIQTEKCCCVIRQQDTVWHVRFSPTDPQYIISISENKVWQWDVNGHQIPPTYNGSYIAFSPDYAQFALCYKNLVTVQNSDSRVIVAEFHVANDEIKHCCFSPDSRLIAVAAGGTAYVWDITNPDPGPIETLVGHAEEITSLAFSSPSSLVSASYGDSVKFWQIGTLSTDPATADPESTPSILPQIYSVSLQAKAGIVISSHIEGMVKVWDISTGLCKASFQTPTKNYWRDVQLIDGRLIAIADDTTIHIWDITNFDPHPIEILLGHTNIITSLTFLSSNSLISASQDRSVRFWQVGASSIDPVVTGPKSGSLNSVPIKSITLQAKDSIVITSDFKGMVKTWDISTGLCKASFQT